MFGFTTAKFIIKIRDCTAGDVASSTDTVLLLGVLPIAVWLADTVPAWLAGEEVALPEFADSDLWLAAGAGTWVSGAAWLSVAAELVALAAWLLLACDPLTTPVADEPDAPEPALPCVFGADCKVVAASGTFSVALVAFWVTLSVVTAFTEWFVKLIPKMVTPNNTEATPTLSLRKL